MKMRRATSNYNKRGPHGNTYQAHASLLSLQSDGATAHSIGQCACTKHVVVLSVASNAPPIVPVHWDAFGNHVTGTQRVSNPLAPAATPLRRGRTPAAAQLVAGSFRSIVVPQTQELQSLDTPTRTSTQRPESAFSPTTGVSARLRPAAVYFNDATTLLSISLDSLPVAVSGDMRLFPALDGSGDDTDAVSPLLRHPNGITPAASSRITSSLQQQQQLESGSGLSLSSNPQLDTSTTSTRPLVDGKYRDAIARRRPVEATDGTS